MSRTPSPTDCAIPVPADVGGLIGIVSAVVVKVAPPQDGDALSVVATELGLGVTRLVVANLVGLV